MNYLGHYFYNHTICRIEPQPYFILGVALPDLWPRFSRRRRIRWKAVRAATARDPQARHLRDGLLNHAAVDQRFHALPSFVRWQRELKASVTSAKPHSFLIDFVAHLALELVLDHRVVCASPPVAEDIYDRIASCSPRAAEQRVSELANVDARGLAQEIDAFVSRRFLPRFAQPDTLPRVVDFVLNLTELPAPPPRAVINQLLEIAQRIVEPEVIWNEMRTQAPAADALPNGAAARVSSPDPTG